jgi:hypothetical protein
MIKAEWITCPDLRSQLIFLEAKGTNRKARLYACGVARFLLPYLGDERSRQIVKIAEMNADGLATANELAAAREAAFDAKRGVASQVVSFVGDHGAWQAARMIVVSIQQAKFENEANDWSGRIAAVSRKLLHCVFGNPFQPVGIDSSHLKWNDGIVVKLAQGIYDERAFDRLAVLADGLEDAGCQDASILGHLRTTGPHSRGCWVVDLLLARE